MLSKLCKFVKPQNPLALTLNSQRPFASTTTNEPLKKTHLYSYHRDILKGKMVPFAGYDMPVLYPEGIIKEHLHCRENAGIFDVSHMG